MMDNVFDNTMKRGTAGGTLLTILFNITKEDLFKTIILAMVGAVVSFTVTLLLKIITKYFKK